MSLSPDQILLQRGNLQRASAGAAAFSGVLDSLGNADGAWSVYRRLFSSFSGSLLRVRRSGDNAELDVGYLANGVLDVVTLESFCNAGGGTKNGFVVKIYDQSDQGRDLIQSTAAAQMKIAANAVAYVETDGVPYMAQTVDNQSVYQTNTDGGYNGSELWAYVNMYHQTPLEQLLAFGATKDGGSIYAAGAVVPILMFSAIACGERDGNFSASNYSISSGRKLYSGSFSASGWSAEDGSDSASDTDVSMQGSLDVNHFILGGSSAGNPASSAGFIFVEAVVYLSDQTSNHAAIRTALTIV